jgi:hypothetical protein
VNKEGKMEEEKRKWFVLPSLSIYPTTRFILPQFMALVLFLFIFNLQWRLGSQIKHFFLDSDLSNTNHHLE